MNPEVLYISLYSVYLLINYMTILIFDSWLMYFENNYDVSSDTKRSPVLQDADSTAGNGYFDN